MHISELRDILKKYSAEVSKLKKEMKDLQDEASDIAKSVDGDLFALDKFKQLRVYNLDAQYKELEERCKRAAKWAEDARNNIKATGLPEVAPYTMSYYDGVREDESTAYFDEERKERAGYILKNGADINSINDSVARARVEIEEYLKVIDAINKSGLFNGVSPESATRVSNAKTAIDSDASAAAFDIAKPILRIASKNSETIKGLLNKAEEELAKLSEELGSGGVEPEAYNKYSSSINKLRSKYERYIEPPYKKRKDKQYKTLDEQMFAENGSMNILKDLVKEVKGIFDLTGNEAPKVVKSILENLSNAAKIKVEPVVEQTEVQKVSEQIKTEVERAVESVDVTPTVKKTEAVTGAQNLKDESKTITERLKAIDTFFDRMELKTGREASNSVKSRYYSSHVGDFADGSDAQLKVAKLAKDARIAALKEEENAMKAAEAERARILKERQDAEKAAADAEARRLKEEVDAVKDAEAAKAKATADRLKAIETYFARMEVKYGRETSNSVKSRYYSSHINDFDSGSDAQLKVAKLAKDAKIAALKEEEAAVRATEAERARILKQRQDAEKAAEDAAKAAAAAEARRYADSLDEVKNYVRNKKILEGKDLTYDEQATYYESQLSKFKKNSKEYIEVLRLKQEAEKKAAAETKNAFGQMLSAVSTICNKITGFINGIVNAIQGVVRFVKTVLGFVKSVFVKIGSGVSGIIKLFGNLGNRVRSVFTGANKDIKGTALTLDQFKRSATEIKSKIELLKSAFDAVFNNKYIDQAKELYMSVYSMKNIMGGELTQSTIDWAESMERAFGVSAKSLIADMNELTGVLYGLGMTGEHVAVGAQNILMISRYLAMFGAAGGNVDTVTNKIISGLKGQTQAIDDLGLSVRETQMQQFLDDLAKQGKIAKTSWQNLNEEQRIYIRYASLIEQYTSKYDITQYAKALNTVTGRITLLKERVKSLAYNVAQVFIVAASKIANFVSYIVSLLDSLVTNIASKLGFSTEMSESMNEMFGDTGIENTTSGLEDMNKELEKVEENAKKTSNALASFDKLEGFTAGSNDSSNNDNLDFSFLMADSLAKMNELAKNSPDFTETLKAEFDKTVQHWKDSINSFFREWNGRDLDLGFDWPTIKSELNNILRNIGDVLVNVGSFVVDIGLNIADDIKLGRLITDLTVLISRFTDLAREVSLVAHPAFKAFYDEALRPVNQFIGSKLSETIRTIAGEFEKWSTWTKTNGALIVEFFDALGRVVGAVWKVFEPYFNATWGRLIGWIVDLGDGLRKAFSEGMESYIDSVDGKIKNATTSAEKLVAAFTGNYSSDGSGTLLDDILLTVSELVNAMKILWKDCIVPLGKELKDIFVNQILPDILEMVRELAGWIQEHSEDIHKFVMEMLPFFWDILKKVLIVIGKIMGYLIEHPGEVKGFINMLVALQVAKIGASLLSGLANILDSITKIKTAFEWISKTKAFSWITGGLKTAGTAVKGWATNTALPWLTNAGGAIKGGLATLGGGSAVAGGGYILGGIQAGRGIYDIYKGVKEGDRDRKNKGAGVLGTVAAGAAIGSVVPGVGTAVGAGIGAGIGGLTSLLGAGFMDEVGAFITETIPQFFSDVCESIGAFITETIPEVYNKVTSAIGTFFTETLPGWFSGIWDDIATFFTETIPNVVSGIIEGVTVFFRDTVPYWFGYIVATVEVFFTETIPNKVAEIVDNLRVFFTETIPNWFHNIVDTITTFFTETIPEVYNTIKTALVNFFTVTLVGWFSDIWNSITTFFTETIPGVYNTVKTALVNFFTVTVAGWFSNLWSSVLSFFTQTIPGVYNTIKTSLVNFFTVTVAGWFSSIWSSVSGFFTQTIPNAISKIGTSIKTFFTETVPNAVKGFFSNIGTNIWDFVTGAGTSFSSGYNAAKSNYSVAPTKIRSIKGNALGGVPKSGSLFFANENGNSELVGNFGGYTGVANQNMIVDAIKQAVIEGMLAVGAGNSRTADSIREMNINIGSGGFNIYDKATLRQFARDIINEIYEILRNENNPGFVLV